MSVIKYYGHNHLLKRISYYCQIILSGFLISIGLHNCAPVFSELQSARTVGKNRIELTPSYSSVNYHNEGDNDGLQNHIGLQAAYGITERIDIRARYERIWMKEGEIGDGVDILGIGPKFSLLDKKCAFYIPLGRALGEGSEDSWELHPTLLFTLPALNNKIDLTFSPKYLITFCKDCDDLIAFNLGIALSTDLNIWAIRPEYGLLFDPGDSGHFAHFSIGFSKTFGK